MSLKETIASDAQLLLADFGEAATYFALGDGAGAAVTVYVAPTDEPARGVRGDFGSSRRTHLDDRAALMVQAATGPDAGGGVDADGGVVKLSESDRFTVPGRTLARVDEATVKVVVVGKVELVGGLWHCEVRP